MDDFMHPLERKKRTEEGSKVKNFLLKIKGKLLLAFVILIFSLGSVFIYDRLISQGSQAARNPEEVMGEENVAVNELEQLLMDVSEHVDLPNNETPQIVTVSDARKLAEEPFFENAENGDRVLIYSKAQSAYLYRPSTDKMINIGPITFPTPTPVDIEGDEVSPTFAPAE